MAQHQYADHDWLSKNVEQAELELIPPELLDTARALVDPGHDAALLRSAAPLPAEGYGVNVFSAPSAVTATVTVNASKDVFILTSPEPSIAFIVYTAGDTGAVAFPTSHAFAACPLNPGFHMQARGYSGVRCTAKSITVENTTPQINRGGYVLARRINPVYATVNQNTTMTIASTSAANQRMFHELPLNANTFEVGTSYDRHSCEGVYTPCALTSLHYDLMDQVWKETTTGAEQPGVSQNVNELFLSMSGQYFGSDSIPVHWTTDMGLDPALSQSVHCTGCNDQMATSAILLRAPAGYEQTFSVKFHARYEYIVDATSPDFSKSTFVYPDQPALERIIAFAAEMPASFDASYNAGGKVWNAFKKGLGWVAKTIFRTVSPVASPLLRATGAAALKGFKSAASAALAR